MTQAYLRSSVKSVIREFQMLPSYAGIRITDTVKCKKASEIYWFAHTKAEIEVASDGKSATLRKDGKTITVTLNKGSEGTFTVMDAIPLPQSKARQNTEENSAYKKLTVHLSNVKETVISVTIFAQ
jgi:hypothetical protein